jgi:16S rRNA C967 or C1407 C5-methylase (RsmB/RsmF family)/NOL1/NOP2/fmu family ribosome biogenesis protein
MAGEAQARGRLHQGLIRPPCRRDETGVMPPTPPGRSAHTRPMRLAPSPWPAEFRRRVEALLGEESAAFFDALSRPRARGMRINPAKTGPAELGRLLQLELTPVPWSELGFTFEGKAGLGDRPAHRAGLFYLQDPAAMSVVEVMDPRPDWWVADLAAAPGGKTTHLLSRLGEEGLVFANDVAGSRLAVLHENLDRWGATGVVTASIELDDLAESLTEAFDAVLLDAPCSAEALLRRDPALFSQWSPAAVSGAARRQGRLLAAAARLVRPGGVLVYSTCTFEVEEDESQVAAFLERQPEWKLAEVVRRPGFDPGLQLPPWPTERTVRLWPHRLPGDGQFVARLERRAGVHRREPRRADRAGPSRGPRRARSRRPDPGADRQVVRQWEEFVAQTCPGLQLLPGRPLARGQYLYHVAAPAQPLPLSRLARPGTPLGAARPGRFQPSHALACMLDPDLASSRVSWTERDEELKRFLRGETVESAGPEGWVLICYERWGIGWGRRSKGVIKNFLPRQLRRRAGRGREVEEEH